MDARAVLVAVDQKNVATFEQAQQAVLSRNPALGMDSKALYFAAQGWMAAQQSAAVGAKGKRYIPFIGLNHDHDKRRPAGCVH